MGRRAISRTLSGGLLVLLFLGLLGVVWWGVVGQAHAASPDPTPEASPSREQPPSRERQGDPDSPLISFIDSPTAQCYQPEQHKDTCYIEWSYLYVTATPGQYIISMTVNIDARLRAYYSGFFQTAMYVPGDMASPGFRVTCGTPGSGGNPKLGRAYSYTIRARETGGLGAANYGTTYCPADVVPPASLDLSGPATGLKGMPYTFTASVSPVTTTLPLTYTWQVTDQAPLVVTGGLTDTQSFTWSTHGLKQIVVTAENAAGSATLTYEFSSADEVVPPVSLDLSGPATGLTGVPYDFTAVVSPVSTTLPLTYTWQVTDQPSLLVAGGASESQSFTWSTHGLKQIIVTAQNAAGSATVTHAFNLPFMTYLPFVIH